MEISFESKLLEYMERKGYHAIAIESISPKGCCADTTELFTRFVRDKDIPKVNVKGCACHETPEGIQIFVLTKGLHYEEHVTFGLRSFFGAKDITVKGIAAFKL